MDNTELEKYIKKFDTEKVDSLSEEEQIHVYNFLEELLMYRKIGLLRELMDLSSKYKKLKYGYELQSDIIKQLEKSNQDLSDRVVKKEGLLSEGEVR